MEIQTNLNMFTCVWNIFKHILQESCRPQTMAASWSSLWDFWKNSAGILKEFSVRQNIAVCYFIAVFWHTAGTATTIWKVLIHSLFKAPISHVCLIHTQKCVCYLFLLFCQIRNNHRIYRNICLDISYYIVKSEDVLKISSSLTAKQTKNMIKTTDMLHVCVFLTHPCTYYTHTHILHIIHVLLAVWKNFISRKVQCQWIQWSVKPVFH